MFALKLFGLAAAAGMTLGTLFTAAFPPTMHFAALRPWQEAGQPSAVAAQAQPVAPLLASSTVVRSGNAGSTGHYIAVIRVHTVGPELMARHAAARSSRHDSDEAPVSPPEAGAAESPDDAAMQADYADDDNSGEGPG